MPNYVKFAVFLYTVVFILNGVMFVSFLTQGKLENAGISALCAFFASVLIGLTYLAEKAHQRRMKELDEQRDKVQALIAWRYDRGNR